MTRRSMVLLAAAVGMAVAACGGALIAWLGVGLGTVLAALAMVIGGLAAAWIWGRVEDIKAATALDEIGAAVGRQRPEGVNDTAYTKDIVASLCVRLERAAGLRSAFAALPGAAAITGDKDEVLLASAGFAALFPEVLTNGFNGLDETDMLAPAGNGNDLYAVSRISLGSGRQLVVCQRSGAFVPQAALASFAEALAAGHTAYRLDDDLVDGAPELAGINEGLAALDRSIGVLNGVLKGDEDSYGQARGLNSGLGRHVRDVAETILDLVEAHQDEAHRRAGLEHKIARIGHLLEQNRSAARRIGDLAKSALAGTHTVGAAVESGRKSATLADEAGRDARAAASKAEALAQSGSAGARAVHAMIGDIEKLVHAIEDVAFRTNLLALNASIEAARAGDSGNGFAVVAEEVRDLAQSASGTAKQIKALVAEGRNETGQGERTSEELGELVAELDAHLRKISNETDKIAQSLNESSGAISDLSGDVQSIVESAEGQAPDAIDSAA